MEEPGGLQSMGSLRVGHDWATSFSLFTFMHWRRKWQPTPVFLPGESQGQRSLVGGRLWGHTELDTTEATLAAAAAAQWNSHPRKFYEGNFTLLGIENFSSRYSSPEIKNNYKIKCPPFFQMYLQGKDKMNLQKITIMFCSPLDLNYYIQYLVPSKVQCFWMSEWVNEWMKLESQFCLLYILCKESFWLSDSS